MNKAELVARVAEKTEMTKKDASQAVEAVFETIKEALRAGDKVQLIGFGNFEVRKRPRARDAIRKPGEEIQIAESKVPAFKPGKALKEEVNSR